MLFPETVLQRAQPVLIGAERLNRFNVLSFDLAGEGEAGQGAFSVYENGATAAHAVFAADMGPCQTCVMPDKVAQQSSGFDFVAVRSSVDGQFNSLLCHGGALPESLRLRGAVTSDAQDTRAERLDQIELVGNDCLYDCLV